MEALKVIRRLLPFSTDVWRVNDSPTQNPVLGTEAFKTIGPEAQHKQHNVFSISRRSGSSRRGSVTLTSCCTGTLTSIEWSNFNMPAPMRASSEYRMFPTVPSNEEGARGGMVKLKGQLYSAAPSFPSGDC